MVQERIQFLREQFNESRSQLNKLIAEVPLDFFFNETGIPRSNIAWHVGHLILSTNYHCINLISGIHKPFLTNPTTQVYMKYCVGLGSKHRVLPIGNASTEELINDLKQVHLVSQQKLSELSDEDLSKPLESTKMKHPFATNKYEALSWAFKHDIWHCAEMELLKMNMDINHKWMPK